MFPKTSFVSRFSSFFLGAAVRVSFFPPSFLHLLQMSKSEVKNKNLLLAAGAAVTAVAVGVGAYLYLNSSSKDSKSASSTGTAPAQAAAPAAAAAAPAPAAAAPAPAASTSSASIAADAAAADKVCRNILHQMFVFALLAFSRVHRSFVCSTSFAFISNTKKKAVEEAKRREDEAAAAAKKKAEADAAAAAAAAKAKVGNWSLTIEDLGMGASHTQTIPAWRNYCYNTCSCFLCRLKLTLQLPLLLPRRRLVGVTQVEASACFSLFLDVS